MKLTNKVYDVLMFIAQVVLPGAATLYAAVGGIWGLPDVTAVVGTLAAVDTFLGAGLKALKNGYQPPTDAKIFVNKSGPTDVYRLEMDMSLDNLDRRMVSGEPVLFKVLPDPTPHTS